MEDTDLEDDIRMERAYQAWTEGNVAALRDLLKDFPRSSNRYTEARYHEGLACFHMGEKDKALGIWKQTILGCPQDPWIYRADWAYTQIVQGGGQTMFSSAGTQQVSLLNRCGYMGNRNPDLAARSRPQAKGPETP